MQNALSSVRCFSLDVAGLSPCTVKVISHQKKGKPHIDRRVSVATTYPAMPRSCHSGSMASRHRHVARDILPNRANRVHTSTGTSCLSSQSMGINGRMRQKTRRMWRHPQLFPYSDGVCTEEREDQRESKEERPCQHESKSSTGREWSIGRKRVGQRLSKAQPRALCFPDCRRTDHALSRMGPHWDAVYIDQSVSRRGRQFQRHKYQPYRRWRIGDWFWWPVRQSTRRLGDEYVAQTRQWIPKSNSQQRLDSSDASPDVKSRVGARTIRSVAAHSSTISTPSVPATVRSVIQPGVVADVPVELGYKNGLDRCEIARSDTRTDICNHELRRRIEAKPIFEIRGEAQSVLPQFVVWFQLVRKTDPMNLELLVETLCWEGSSRGSSLTLGAIFLLWTIQIWSNLFIITRGLKEMRLPFRERIECACWEISQVELQRNVEQHDPILVKYSPTWQTPFL